MKIQHLLFHYYSGSFENRLCFWRSGSSQWCSLGMFIVHCAERSAGSLCLQHVSFGSGNFLVLFLIIASLLLSLFLLFGISVNRLVGFLEWFSNFLFFPVVHVFVSGFSFLLNSLCFFFVVVVFFVFFFFQFFSIIYLISSHSSFLSVSFFSFFSF